MTAAALAQARALRVDVSPVERAVAALGPVLADVEVLADESATYAGVRGRLIGAGDKLLAFHATLAPQDFRGRIWKSHRQGLEALLARPGVHHVRLETRAGLADGLTVGLDLEAAMSLDDVSAYLAAATNTNEVTRERLRSLLSMLGTTALGLGDRLAPPGLLTRTVWMQPEGDLVRLADKLAETLQLLPAQRTLMARHLGLARPKWIGLRATFDAVMPEIHVAYDADPAFAARLLADTGHDEVRALIRARTTIEVRYHAEGQPLALVRAPASATVSPATAAASVATMTKDDASFGVIAARVGTAAATNGIEVTPLLAALQSFGASLARHTRVTMTGEADRLRVLFPVPRDPAGKAALAELARGAVVPEPSPGAYVELATIPRKPELEVWLHDEGSPTWDRVVGLVDDPSKLRELFAMIEPGGPRGSSRRLGAKDALVHGIVGGDRAVPVITKLAEAVSIHPAQRKLIGNIHPLLAHGHDTLVALRIGELGNVVPEVRVVYRHVPLETVVRVVAPIRPGHDAGKAIGNLAGALQAKEAAMLTLVLRPEDPMRALIAIDLVPGTDLA